MLCFGYLSFFSFTKELFENMRCECIVESPRSDTNPPFSGRQAGLAVAVVRMGQEGGCTVTENALQALPHIASLLAKVIHPGCIQPGEHIWGPALGLSSPADGEAGKGWRIFLAKPLCDSWEARGRELKAL